MPTLHTLATSLIKGKMGGKISAAENEHIILELRAFGKSQATRAYLLVIVLILLLVIPVFVTQLKMQPSLYPYFIGGSGLFAAGTVKLLLKCYQELSRAQTLVVLCRNLKSDDAKDVLKAWLKV